MPIRRNGYYQQDPAIAKGLSNIATMFAPPSGADLAGGATARAKLEEAQRAAALYDYAKSPEYKQELFDRMAVATGNYNPTQSFYAQNQNNATTQRSQDLVYSASRQNNTADNARALQTNAADNTRAVATSLLSPVGDGQVRYVPPSIADQFKVDQTQRGNVTLKPGEQTTLSGGGGVISGAPVPLTTDQVAAATLMEQPMADRRAVAMAGVKPTEVVKGGKRVFVNAADAAGAEAPPDPSKVSELATLQNERAAIAAANPNDPRIAEYGQRIQALGRGQQQGKYDQSTDEDLSKLNTGIYDNAVKASADQGTYAALTAAINNPSVDQGALAQVSLSLKKTLNAFGVDAGNTGPAEMLNALGNSLALRLRDPSGGAGMPGAMSDADREFLKTMTISQGNSPQANRMLAQFYLASQQKALDLNSMRENYVKKNGRIDEGFRSEVTNYLRTNDPTSALRNEMAGGSGAAGATASAGAPAGAPAAPAPPPQNRAGGVATPPPPASGGVQTVPDEAAALALPPGTRFKILSDGRTGTVQ